MAEIDITTIAKAISRIQTSYNNMALSWYDIFFNPEPKMVPVSWYNSDGSISEYNIPNRALDQKYITNGEGSPEGVRVADIGTAYQDIENGVLYIKTSSNGLATGWSATVTAAEVDNLVRHGTGEPEGVVTAPIGTLFVREDLIQRGPYEKVGGYLYMKRTTSGNTGWERIDSYPAALIKETFIVRRNADDINKYDICIGNTVIKKAVDGTQIELSGICTSKEVMNIYLDGACLTPDTFTLLKDHKTIRFEQGINFPLTEPSCIIGIQYFIDVHVCDSEVYNEIVYLDANTRQYLYGDVEEVKSSDEVLPWDKLPEEYKRSVYSYWLDVRDKFIDITESIEHLKDTEKELEGQLRDYEKELEEELKKYVNEVDTSWKEMYADVNNTYTEIVNLRTLIRADVVTCQNWYDKIYALYKKIEADKEFIEVQYEQGNIVTKWEQPADMIRAPWYASLQDQITTNKSSIEEEVTNLRAGLTYKIEETDEQRKQYVDARDLQLQSSINLNKTNIAVNARNLEVLEDTFRTADLADFSNARGGYYNAENFPISKNGLLANSGSSYVDEDGIIDTTLYKDTCYYSVSLTKAIEEGREKFVFGLSLSDEVEALKGATNSVVLVAKVLFINRTLVAPNMTWTNDIIWLNSELLFEANKDYLLEFISYDFGETWYVQGPNQIAVNTEETIAEDEIIRPEPQPPIYEEPEEPSEEPDENEEPSEEEQPEENIDGEGN